MTAAWQTTKLGEICEFVNGLWKGEKPPFVKAGVIRNTNFSKDGALDYSDIAYLDVEERKLEKRRLQYGDIILEKSGGGPKQPVGRVALFEKMEGVFSFSNFTSALRVRHSTLLDFRFLHWFLQWIYLSGKTVAIQSNSTGIRNLNSDAYKAIEIAFPQLAEQKRIVALLDQAFETIYAAIGNTEQKCRLAQELLSATLESSFDQQRMAVTEHQSLEQLTEQDSPITYGVVKPGSEGDVVFVRGGDISQGRIRLEELRTIAKSVSSQYRRTLLRGGELLMCLVGQPGQVAVAPPSLARANIARQVGLIRLRREVNAEYVRYFLQSPLGQRRLVAKTSGSVQQVINLGELRQISVPLPSRTIQDGIVQRLDELTQNIDRLKEVSESKLVAIGELRSSLLDHAFAGRL